MAMGPVGRVTALGLLLLISQFARGQGQLLLLDRSGSMRPYYESGLMVELGRNVTNVVQAQNAGTVSVAAFNDHVEMFPDVSRVSVNGPTYLDVAMDYAIDHRYSVVWLVTDNIMHRSGEEEGRTTVFYEKLKQAAVERVVIFPLKQEAGKGHAGIIVYALLLSSPARGAFESETVEFARITPNTVRLPMKPLDRETIETIFDESATTRNKPNYTDGSTIHEDMGVRFRSKFAHLRIADADITNPRVSPEFSKNSLLTFEKGLVTIDPKKIVELGPGGETTQHYKVSVDLGKIKLKRDPLSLWRAALRDPNEDVSLDLAFSISVPKEKFQFTEDFLNNYSARTTEQAKAEGKIYGLNDLPLLVAENRTSIDVPHKPKIHVTYPWWLVFVFPGVPIFVLVLLAAAGILIWRLAKKAVSNKPQWSIEAPEPAGAKAFIERGTVTVTADKVSNRLGRIRGTSFISAPGVAPQGTQSIKDGATMRLSFRRKNFALRFRRVKTEERNQNRKDGKRNGTRGRPKI